MEDLELIRGLRLKDDASIESLYDLYGADVYSLISKMNAGDSSELTIKTFESFAQSISQFNPKNQTIWNELMSHARSVTQKHRLSGDISIKVDEIENSIEKPLLNDSYSEIIDKVFVKAISLSDITKYLSIPASTARTRFRLAINSLKNKYNKDAGKFLGLVLISQMIMI